MSAMDQLIRLSVKRKVVVLVILIVLVGIVFWFFFHSPLRDELEGLKKAHARLQQQKADANRRKATYEKDRAKRDELKKSITQQLRALPSDAEMSSFLNSLNTQAELVGLEIVSVKPQKEEISKYYAKIPVQLELTGTFHQLAKFFYLVGNLDRIINIENINFRLKAMEDSGAVLSASVLATTFRSIQDSSNQPASVK